MAKIAIFGGTFDPVHIGHIALVVALKEAHNLDSVLIIPANQNPFKDNQLSVDANHRLAMLKKAFRDLPYCKVLPLEIKRPGPSYTIDTIRELKDKKLVTSRDTLYLILGEDQLASLHSWKEADALMQQVVPLVARRRDAAMPRQNYQHICYTDTPYFEVSSTDIRNRLKKNLYCGHLLNNLVYNYIQRHNLYA